MTVEAIRLQNFMAFADTDWIELSPITLLFGRNSSGKSVIIRALRLLRQSLDQPPGSSPLLFVAEHGLDQGNFEHTINNRVLDDPDADEENPRKRVMWFHFRCRLDTALNELQEVVNQVLVWYGEEPVSGTNKETLNWADLSLGYALGYDFVGKIWQVELVSVQINCPWPALEGRSLIFAAERLREDTPVEIAAGEDNQTHWKWSDEWRFWSDDFLFGHKTVANDGDWSDVSIRLSQGFLPHLAIPGELYRQGSPVIDDVKFVNALLADMREEIAIFLRSIHYLGPIRPEPQRSYPFNQAEEQKWRSEGWGAWVDFLSLRMGDSKTIDEVGKWLDYLELGPQVRPEARHLLDLGFISHISVFEVEGGAAYSLKDIGYGASQVLPILVQSLLAEPGSIVIIEQPELHLHPAAQAELSDLFIQRALTPTGPRFLLETHSAH